MDQFNKIEELVLNTDHYIYEQVAGIQVLNRAQQIIGIESMAQ